MSIEERLELQACERARKVHETPEDRVRRWQDYRATFARAMRVVRAKQPDTDDIRAYFDDSIGIEAAVGHYLIEAMRNRCVALVGEQ